jgi:hypothetical protein
MDSISSRKRGLAMGWMLPLTQLLATLLILGLDIVGALKLAAFVAIWALTFRRLSLREALCFLAVSGLFSIMDIVAVRQGLLTFLRPDFAGLPVWEFFMWGFYVLHMLRTWDGPAPSPNRRLVLPLAVLFAVPFAVVNESPILLLATGAILAVAVFFFHEPQDLVYAGYALLLGAAVEYVGVWTGQWQYPAHPVGGVELWFTTMWAGIGLFTRRLLLPLTVQPND